jgi:hypothetical protein
MTSENIKTPEFRVSFPYVFEPQPLREGDEAGKVPKYSVTMLFPKGADLTGLKKAVQAVLVEKFGADQKKWPKGLRLPFRDQGEKVRKDSNGGTMTDSDGNPVLQDGHVDGAVFISATSKNRPGLVSTKPDPRNPKLPAPIDDPAEFYAGCYAVASVRPYHYKVKGNEGIAFGLQNIQKTKDGDPLGGRMRPQDEFAPVADAAGDAEDPLGLGL